MTVIPEQKAILAKFAVPLSPGYFDAVRYEYSQHPSTRAQIAAFFCENMESALGVASVPFQLCLSGVYQRRFERVLSSERIRALKKVSPGEQLSEALEKEAHDIATARFRQEQTTEEHTKHVTPDLIRDLGMFLETPWGVAAAPELLLQAVVMIWAALEVFVSDVIRHEMNTDPSLAFRVATTDPARRHFANRFSIEQLASMNFNLEKSMGDALLADRSLDSLPVIRDVISAIAAADAPVHKTFAEKELWQLWQIRHLIVHRRGRVDRTYIDRTGDTTRSVGNQIILDSTYVEQATDIVRNAAIVFMRCWRDLRPAPAVKIS